MSSDFIAYDKRVDDPLLVPISRAADIAADDKLGVLSLCFETIQKMVTDIRFGRDLHDAVETGSLACESLRAILKGE